MTKETSSISPIDDYILQFPDSVQSTLRELKRVILEAAPDSLEKISYAMPTFYLHGGNLVHFAAYKGHIGFYPSSSGIEKFKTEISNYKWSKGAVQFPINEPLPFDLISRIVKFRAQENLEIENLRKNKKKSK